MANEQNLKPFKPGQSGNPKGRKKGSKNRSTIAREMLAVVSDTTNPFDLSDRTIIQMTNEEKATAALLLKAINEGDVQAYRAIMDSAYGTPKQTIEHSEGKEKPTKVRFFDPENKEEEDQDEEVK